MYSFHHVTFKYDDYILKDFTLDIKEKKIGITGNNGVGKTTLLRLMNGELTPDAGEISINGDTYFVQYEERGLVIVSHDMNMLRQSVEKIYRMENKGLNSCEIRVL